jgi:hypothetical protein
MIVAFWSNVHGQPRTTSNMVAVAVTIALAYNRKCLVTQTHFNLNNLEAYLIENRENSKDIYMDMGLDGLASIIKLRAMDKATIENYSIPLLNKNLTLLPGTTGGNRKTFIDDMDKTVSMILSEMNKCYEMVFVDVNSGADEVSKLILDKADIIVVNLSQNKSVLDNYITSYQLMNKKVMYLFGSYDRDSSYNLHNLKLMYKPLSKGVTGVIPYNTEFMDAQSDGCVLKYMKKNMAAPKDTTSGNFIECVKDAADKLMKLAGEKRGGMIQ